MLASHQQLDITRDPGVRAQLEAALDIAERVDTYGALGELELSLTQGRFEDALQLVRRLRLQDNIPLGRNGRIGFSLRQNDFLLLQLEAKIVGLMMLVMDFDDIEAPPAQRYSLMA